MKQFNESQLRNNLICARARKGYTQSKVAELLNIHPRTLQRWENDPIKISIDDLKALSIVYSCKVSDFFMDCDDTQSVV